MLAQARPEAVVNRWLVALMLVVPFFPALAPAPASAQELSDRATERCTRAAVRIQVDVPGGSSTGSGSIIDERGYVLTNFHVVGFTQHGERGGAPGTFFGDGEHVQIATVTSARDTATTRYIGRVVRGDVRLDLALIRIVSNADGTPIAAGTTFPTVELATTEALQPGANLWAFGFPLGVRTINVTGGRLTGFQMSTSASTSAASLVSWIRTDVEFNPGNSGGMLVDRRGRLVAVPTAVMARDTLEPIEFARPVERMPSEWTTSLVAGQLDTQIISGMPELTAGQEIVDHAMGDSGNLGGAEIFYYRLPSERPGTITVTPALPLGLIGPRGDVGREGRGSVMLYPQDPGPLYLAVLIERPTDGTAVELHVRFEQTTAPPPTPQAGPYGPYPPAPYGYPRQPSPYPPQYGSAYPQPSPRSPYPTAPAGPPVAVHGRLIDAASGAAIVGGIVMLAQPGVDLRAAMALLAAGRITQAQLDAQILARAQTDADGHYTLEGIPRGRYSGAGVATGFTPAMITLTIGPSDPAVIEALPIQIGR